MRRAAARRAGCLFDGVAVPVDTLVFPRLLAPTYRWIDTNILALKRENRDTLYSSMIKDTLKRKKPQFDESYHGYRTWQDLLEDMERNGVIQLTTDPRSGTFVVTGFGKKK